MEHKTYKTVDAALRGEDPLHGHVEPWGTSSLESQPVRHQKADRELAVYTGLVGAVAAGLIVLVVVGLFVGWI